MRVCILLFKSCVVHGLLLSHKTIPYKWGNKSMIQHIGKEIGGLSQETCSGALRDGIRWQLLLTLPKSQRRAAIWPPWQALLSTNTKPRHWAQNPGPKKGNGNHSLPVSNLRGRVLASGSFISSANYLKLAGPTTFPRFPACREAAHFHPFVNCSEVKGSKTWLRTHGSCCAPLARSRKENAEARSAQQASTSDKYDKSHPSNQ